MFEFMSLGAVVVTTPNREYNVLFENLASGKLRWSASLRVVR